MKRPTPPTYRPNPLPRVLQAKSAKHDEPTRSASLVAPPEYRPQPTPKVLQKKSVSPAQQRGRPVVGQTVQAKVSAIKTTPTAPLVYSPQPKNRVLQTKQIPKLGLSTNTVQLSEGDKRREKERQRQEAIKKSAGRRLQQSADNAVAYGGLTPKEGMAAAKAGVRIPGHHSADSNSKMNDGTKKAIAGLHAAKRAEKAAAKAGDDSSEEEEAKPSGAAAGGGGGGGGGGGAVVAITLEELEAAAVGAWNRAVDKGESGLDGMTAYLNGRVKFDRVPRALADNVLAVYAEFPPADKV